MNTVPLEICAQVLSKCTYDSARALIIADSRISKALYDDMDGFTICDVIYGGVVMDVDKESYLKKRNYNYSASDEAGPQSAPDDEYDERWVTFTLCRKSPRMRIEISSVETFVQDDFITFLSDTEAAESRFLVEFNRPFAVAFLSSILLSNDILRKNVLENRIDI